MTAPPWWAYFLERLECLKELIPQAIADGDRDMPVSPASMENAKAFASSLVGTVRPGVFVQQDGMTVLTWRSGKIKGVHQFTEQVEIRFHDDDRVEFVLFRLEKGDLGTSYVMGMAHSGAVLGMVSALGLDHVMKAD